LRAALLGTLIAALVATSGCSLLDRAATPEALREVARTFYQNAVAGPQPYEQHSGARVTPSWWQLPLDQQRLVSGEIISVDPVSGSRDLKVVARVTAGAGEQTIVYHEETLWRYTDGAWRLLSAGVGFVAGSQMTLPGWTAGGARQTGGGLVAWQFGREVWVLDPATGALQRLVEPAEANAAQPGLYVVGWSPSGSALLLTSEDAAYFWRPANSIGSAWQLVQICRIGNLGGAFWSPDGRYLALDLGTDVVRTVEIIDVASAQRIGTLTTFGTVAWAGDGSFLLYDTPETVAPPLPAHDGASSSFAIARIANGAVTTEIVARGTTQYWYSVGGFGRDGQIHYKAERITRGPGQTAQTWYRWDLETRTATALPTGQRPTLETAPEAATITLPSGLSAGGAARVRVAVSEEGRWGAFAAQAGELGSGIYLIDLTAPTTYVRVAKGSSPQWQVTR
jgi:hypothetical protein